MEILLIYDHIRCLFNIIKKKWVRDITKEKDGPVLKTECEATEGNFKSEYQERRLGTKENCVQGKDRGVRKRLIYARVGKRRGKF